MARAPCRGAGRSLAPCDASTEATDRGKHECRRTRPSGGRGGTRARADVCRGVGRDAAGVGGGRESAAAHAPRRRSAGRGFGSVRRGHGGRRAERRGAAEPARASRSLPRRRKPTSVPAWSIFSARRSDGIGSSKPRIVLRRSRQRRFLSDDDRQMALQIAKLAFQYARAKAALLKSEKPPAAASSDQATALAARRERAGTAGAARTCRPDGAGSAATKQSQPAQAAGRAAQSRERERQGRPRASCSRASARDRPEPDRTRPVASGFLQRDPAIRDDRQYQPAIRAPGCWARSTRSSAACLS